MKLAKYFVGVVLGFAAPSAMASLYIESGIECLDNGPTVSVGELVEIEINFGQEYRRGTHIQFYSKVLNTLKRAKLHRAGDSHPIKATKLADGTFAAEVSNDFGEKFKYTLSPKAGELELTIVEIDSGDTAYEVTYKNCSPIR